MKITLEKNLVFGDQAKPFLANEVATKIKPRKVLKPLAPVQMDLNFNLATEGSPKMRAVLDENKRAVLRVANFKVGQHVFPPSVKAQAILPWELNQGLSPSHW